MSPRSDSDSSPPGTKAVERYVHRVPLGPSAILAVHRFGAIGGGAPVVALHGSIGNGKIFYSSSGRGLAPYLAGRGYTVYAPDFRGRGRSTPLVREANDFDQRDLIVEDIPAAVELARSTSGAKRVHVIAHSWGGVLLLSAMARLPELRGAIGSVALFGTKRVIRARGLRRMLAIDLFWNRAGLWLSRSLGYLPARALRVGSDDESYGTHRDCVTWANPGPWVDPSDGFDYGAAWQAIGDRPRLRAWAAINDPYLGHPVDCAAFLREAGIDPDATLTVLSRSNGDRRNYDHINMLTHPDARHDLYPRVADWLADNAP